MNALDVDFKKYIPNIIDAFVQVYGEEYRYIIAKRINSIQYVIYNNVNGISSYHSFLSTCKKQELALKFLNQIGIDTSKYNVKSYAEHLDDDINTLLLAYIDGVHWGFHSEFKQEPEGIKAFGTMKKDTSQKRILDGQLNFLNFYRGKDKEPLTLETIEQFKETQEYSSISKKIDEYLHIYSLLFAEYEQYLETIKEYEDYYKSESQRRLDILEAKKSELYNSINLFMPTSIKNMLDNNCANDKDKAKILFNDGIIWSKLYIEYFSQKDEDKINNPTLEESEKKWIYYYRISFFKSLGFNIDPWKEKDNYNEFIQRKDIKPLIPTAEFIKRFTKYREQNSEEAIKDFICSSETYAENIQKFADNPVNREAIYLRMKDAFICITGGTDNFNHFTPILFYTVKSGDGGKLDYIFLHEVDHALEAESSQGKGYRSGFDYVIGDISSSPYNDKKRKYERINEVFTDIFSIEARNILHKKGIYFADIPAHTIYNVDDYNTCSLLKKLVAPLLERFHPQIIEARLFGKIKKLCDIIGVENYEALNDSINKVDFLLDKGLWKKIQENENEDPLVVEYTSQLARVEQIYKNIDMQNFADTQVTHKY